MQEYKSDYKADIVSMCNDHLNVAYYEDGDPEQKHGFLQKNMIIRKDKQDLDEQLCQTRDEIYTIGYDIIRQTGNKITKKGTVINFIKSENKQASFVSLKKLSETNDYVENIDNNRIYKIYSIVENILTPLLILYNLLIFLFQKFKHANDVNSTFCNQSQSNTDERDNENSVDISIQS